MRADRSRRALHATICVAAAALLSGALGAQASIAVVFRDNSSAVLERIGFVIDAMPSDQFAFRATRQQRSFADLVADFAQKTNQICAQVGHVQLPNRGPLGSGTATDSVRERARRAVANCGLALANLDDHRLGDTVYVRTTGQDGPMRPRTALAAMTMATAFWEGVATELSQYERLVGRIPPIACSGPSGDQNCDNSINRCVDTRPGATGRMFTILDASNTVQSDGRGPYVRGKANVGVVYLARIAVMNLADFRFDTLPRRSVRVDLGRPVAGDISRSLGTIIDSSGVEVSAQWGRDSNFVTRSLLDIPVDSTVVAQQVEVGFHISGVYHALQAGPQPWGHCFSDGTAVNGDGTSRGTIKRVSDSRWEVDLPSGSIARLFDISHSSPNAVNQGRYYISLHFVIER
jgi:hypothetical protein